MEPSKDPSTSDPVLSLDITVYQALVSSLAKLSDNDLAALKDRIVAVQEQRIPLPISPANSPTGKYFYFEMNSLKMKQSTQYGRRPTRHPNPHVL